ncbi:MAG: glycosyltransferase [Lachnospiraceae bacterium]|nr:glycosyltransferase [Lachnospiraceae bacterium]
MKKNKIVVIGPVYPYKGGISHYTGLLVRALRERFDVSAISYSMQYPKVLFKKEQRDYSNDSFKVDAEFVLNTASPVSIIKTARYINSLKPELVIIQWWHPYFSICYTMLAMFLKSKILFVCHNVFPHERFPMDKLLTRMTLKKGSYYILHSSLELDALKTIVKDPKYRVNMHPTYSAFDFSGGAGQDEKEEGLLFFGFVRPYKGLKYLIEAMKAVPGKKLNIVGDFGTAEEEYRELIRTAGIDKRTTVVNGYVPDKEVEKYFRSCEAVVLPYTDATQSGIAQIAFGFKKPVIATDAGGLPEVVTDGKTGIICKRKDPEDLARAIKRFYELKDKTDFKKNIEADAARFSWEHMVDNIKELALK